MRILTLTLTLFAASLVMALTTPTAIASDACKHETCWGAVGFGADSKRGYSYWYSSEDKAVDRVRKECPTCEVIKSFANQCGSLAEGDSGKWGFAVGANKNEARGGAKAICASNGGQNCKVRVWGCSRKKS